MLIDVTIDLKHLQTRLQAVNMILSTWKYQFPNLISYLIKLLCEMIKVGNRQGQESLTGVDPAEDNSVLLEKRRRDAQSIALSCIHVIFKDFPKLQFTLEDIELIFETFVKPQLLKLENMSTGGESGLLRLLLLWGSVRR